MIRDIVEAIVPYVDFLVLLYSLALIISYLLLGIVASYSLLKYLIRNRSTDYNAVFYAEELEPSISIIASSYNESATIIECVRALLALHYNNYEVIVVNDGSTDDSLEKMAREFKLQKVDYMIDEHIKTQPVRGIYRSTDQAYHNLIIVDKENGGKADAMNCGTNVSTKLYLVCVDVDSILSSDALLKLVKPVIESKGEVMVCVGGAVHVANGCLFDEGVLVERRVPKGYYEKMQVVEYLRTFLIGRIAWGEVNGLMLVSGALGLFRKDFVLTIGGYLISCIGEDMEMVVRLRRYLYKNKIKHGVAYIPEPLLWTETPSTFKILERQRTRWTRGLIDTLRLHKTMLFNPRYGVIGIISYPFFVFFEWLAPFIEVLGIIFVSILISLGMIEWEIYAFLFVLMYLFGVCYSFAGILLGEMTYHVYEKKIDLWKLFAVSLTECLLYHPLIVYWALKGNWMFIRGKKGWGTMSRKGFRNKQ